MKEDRRKRQQRDEEERRFDALVELLRPAFEHIQRQTTFLDLNRARQLLTVYRRLQSMTQEQEGVCVTYRMCEPLKTIGSVTVEGPELEFHNMKEFGQLMLLASNVEIYPLTNGNLRMTFGFNDLSRPIE